MARDLNAELREELEEILPKSQHVKIDWIIAAFDAYYDIEVREIEVIGAHLDVTSVEYPGGSVGLDAAGNMVNAIFDDACQIIT